MFYEKPLHNSYIEMSGLYIFSFSDIGILVYIYKKGLIARHVGELGIDRIEGVSVSQGVWGRIWGYGTIIIRGMGVGEVILPSLIEEPIAFRKAIQEARSIREQNKNANGKAAHQDF